jgi:hypothetical protein
VPTNVSKYRGESNPSVWLEDPLACLASSTNDDYFIIQYMPLYLANLAGAWLEYLPGGCICTGPS